MSVKFNESLNKVYYLYEPEGNDWRKPYWEYFAVDRFRFENRVLNLQSIINPVLDHQHRKRIYFERFQIKQCNSS